MKHELPRDGPIDLAHTSLAEIPPGVNPIQLDFLRAAFVNGAFTQLKPETAEMIDKYYYTEVTYADLAKEYGVHPTSVRERITRGIKKLHRTLMKLDPKLEDKYPFAHVIRGKDETEIFKTERHKQRRSEAHRRNPVVTPDKVFVVLPPLE